VAKKKKVTDNYSFYQKLNWNCPDAEKSGSGPGSCGGGKNRNSDAGSKARIAAYKQKLKWENYNFVKSGKAAAYAQAFGAKPKIEQEDLWKHAKIDGESVQALLDQKRGIAVKEKLSKDELGKLSALNDKLSKVDFMGGVKYHPQTVTPHKFIQESADKDMDQYHKELRDGHVADLESGKVTSKEMSKKISDAGDEILGLAKHNGENGIEYDGDFKEARIDELR